MASVPPSVAQTVRPGRADGEQVVLSRLRGLKIVEGLGAVDPKGSAVKGVDPSGLTPLSDPDFIATLGAYLDRPITLNRLDEISAMIVQRYRDTNHPLVDVVVPDQDVTLGTVQLAVVEFKIGGIRAENNRWFSDSVLLANIPAKVGDRIDAPKLLRYVASLNENPFRVVDLVYERGETLGEANIVLRSEDRFPLRVYVGADNEGSPTLSRDRLQAGFEWGNAFGLGHDLSYQATASPDLLTGNPAVPDRPDKPRYLAQSASYQIPLAGGDSLSLLGIYSEQVPVLEQGLSQIGTSSQISARYALALNCLGECSRDVRLGYDFKRSNSNLAFGGTAISRQSTDINQFVLEFSDRIKTPDYRFSLSSEVVVSPGGIGERDNTGAYLTGAGGRPGIRADYIYGQLGGDLALPSIAGSEVFLRALGQLSPSILLPSEQFGLGGETTIRGFEPYVSLGDQGWLASAEWPAPAFSPLRPFFGDAVPENPMVLLLFADAGQTFNYRPAAGQRTTASLASVGAGLRFTVGRYLVFRGDYGWPLLDHTAVGHSPGRIHFSAVLGY